MLDYLQVSPPNQNKILKERKQLRTLIILYKFYMISRLLDFGALPVGWFNLKLIQNSNVLIFF